MFQYDVKSTHAAVSGLMIGGRVRLKGAVMFPFTGSTGHAAFVNDNFIAGTFTRTTTTATVTSVAHGLIDGQWVYLNWGLLDDPYKITVTGVDTFTVTVADSGLTSGTVEIYNEVLLQADASNATAFSMLIPGDGIVSTKGIRVFLPAQMHTTIFYG